MTDQEKKEFEWHKELIQTLWWQINNLWSTKVFSRTRSASATSPRTWPAGSTSGRSSRLNSRRASCNGAGLF